MIQLPQQFSTFGGMSFPVVQKFHLSLLAETHSLITMEAAGNQVRSLWGNTRIRILVIMYSCVNVLLYRAVETLLLSLIYENVFFSTNKVQLKMK